MEQYIFCFSSLIYDILSSATISHFLTFFAAEFFRYFLLYACHYFLWKFLTIPKFQSEKLSCISVEMHSIKNRTITFLQPFPTDHKFIKYFNQYVVSSLAKVWHSLSLILHRAKIERKLKIAIQVAFQFLFYFLRF